MAVLSQRLHRLGDLGYDVIHFETESKLVLRPDGTNMEVAFQNLERKLLETTTKFRDTLPSGITPGTLVVVGSSVYIGDENGVPLHLAGPELDTSSTMEMVDL